MEFQPFKMIGFQVTHDFSKQILSLSKSVEKPRFSIGLAKESQIMHIVTPGEQITETDFMRGHGTVVKEEKLYSLLAGIVEPINKLVSVRSLGARYTGDIGDVVVGRITDIGQNRWKVDIQSRLDAVLLLSSIQLPGSVQRRKNEMDQLEMHKYFNVGDLLVAEVQQFFADGAASLHTRSIKYGKLRNGSLVIVPSSLIKRSKSHFLDLVYGVSVILGLNGYVWVCKPYKVEDESEMYSSKNLDSITPNEREMIARVCNCISLLAKNKIQITETILVYAIESSLAYSISQILDPDHSSTILEQAKQQFADSMEV